MCLCINVLFTYAFICECEDVASACIIRMLNRGELPGGSTPVSHQGIFFPGAPSFQRSDLVGLACA
jgi:hypothetical protein